MLSALAASLSTSQTASGLPTAAILMFLAGTVLFVGAMRAVLRAIRVQFRILCELLLTALRLFLVAVVAVLVVAGVLL
jgi:hypothetical protein